MRFLRGWARDSSPSVQNDNAKNPVDRTLDSEDGLFVKKQQLIGIVGGVGPYAGLDLATKIFDQTIADRDQEHLPLALLSMPAFIHDRTAFLTGQSADNPGHAIAEVIRKLEEIGATVVGIPCNTAHAPRIFSVIQACLTARGSRVQLLHMVDEVARFLATRHHGIDRIGLLATTGTVLSGVYQETFAAHGCDVIVPDDATQELVQTAIYDPQAGIKAHSHPVTEWTRDRLLRVADALHERGAQAVILVCTEIPLALPENRVAGLPAVDATWILARALIREVAPEKLRAVG
jgi:aspartate racemase